MLDNREAKVSVVIPAYQEGTYIQTLLARLVKVKDLLEIIVVDGGSTDETVRIAKKYTDRVYELGQRGIAKARNYGARQSNGTLIVFLDADVTPPLDFTKRILDAFEDRKVVGATCQTMPRNPRFFEKIFFVFYNGLLRLTASLKPHSRGEFLAVRREVFLNIGGFDDDLPCLEDHDLAFRISKHGVFLFLSDLTVYESMRRFRKTGLSNVVKTWVLDYLSLVLRRKTISKTWTPVR